MPVLYTAGKTFHLYYSSTFAVLKETVAITFASSDTSTRVTCSLLALYTARQYLDWCIALVRDGRQPVRILRLSTPHRFKVNPL